LWTSEEFFTAFGVTPEAGVENLDDKGIMVATEGDVSALTSMMILNYLTGSPASGPDSITLENPIVNDPLI
jgi:L-fucose isomerase-like protein